MRNMGKGRTWTKEEINYLSDKYGQTPIKQIAKNLNRTPSAIRNKVTKLGLGSFLENGDYITFNQLKIVLGYNGSGGYMNKSWIKDRGLPVRGKKVENNYFTVIKIDDFWEWAEKNKSFLDFSKFEPLALGAEPSWVKAKRRYDISKNVKLKKTKWTQKEDEYLVFLLNQYTYGYKELSNLLSRSEGEKQRRICDLKLKQRQVKADNHTPWTDKEKDIVINMIKDGADYKNISDKLEKRSAKAIQGLMERTYKTSNLDKIRIKMQDDE